MIFRQQKKISNLSVKSLAELRKIARILVIDDDPNSFPIELLKKEGYAIDYWQKVDNLTNLEEGRFDIIFLDIQGVAEEYSAEDGLGVLDHLKKVNPSQIVVAFSGHSYDLTKNRFWRLADDSLAKPVDATKCKRLIDELIKEKMTPNHYWAAIESILQNQGTNQRVIDRIEDIVARSVETNDDKSISNIFAKTVKGADVALRLTTIAMKIVALL